MPKVQRSEDAERISAGSMAIKIALERFGHYISTRAWCESFAKTLPVQRIERDGHPYLERYFVGGWNPITKRPGPSIFLHHFVASDSAEQVHSHPWAWSCSLILVGGYREYRCMDSGLQTFEYREFDLNLIGATDRHRIELLERDCWTLFPAVP